MLLVLDPSGEKLGLSPRVLRTTPFQNFLIPGLFLIVAVGATNLVAFFYLLKDDPKQFVWSMFGGLMIGGWIIIQMMFIQTFFWLQLVYLFVGFLSILISFQLRKKWIV